MIQPIQTVEEQLVDRVLDTLSNGDLDALTAYATLLQDGKEHEPTPDQRRVLRILSERCEEISTTGKLTAEPWGWQPRHP